MAKIGVCAETFFSDLPYDQRMRKIAALGFTRYELWFHDKRFDGARLHDEPKDFDTPRRAESRSWGSPAPTSSSTTPTRA